MDNLILKRCKYCDKKYEGISDSSCCSDSCNSKFEKYMTQRKKSQIPLRIIYSILWLLLLINLLFFSNNSPMKEYFTMTILLLFATLNIIFPFGEDKGLQKRGVKKTKILLRTIWIVLLSYGLIICLIFLL